MCGVVKISKIEIIFSKETLNWSKVSVKTLHCQKIQKITWFQKVKQHNCFNIDKKSVAPNLHIRMISERSCDSED